MIRAAVKCGLALAAGLFFPNMPAVAQVQQLAELANRLDKEIKPIKPHLIAVVDLRPPYGTNMPQGHYFSWLLSTILETQHKKKLTVADHPAFDADLVRLHLTPEALVPGDSLHAAAPQIGADLLITGTIEKRGSFYFLQLTPVHLTNSETLGTLTLSIEDNEFFESMLRPFPSNVPRFSGRQKPAGSSGPSCIYCPDPSYTDPARSAKINGTVILGVLISATGEPTQIRPEKLIGYGLDEKAYEAIKKWRFRPARVDGSPVPVIVPVEVTFRIF